MSLTIGVDVGGTKIAAAVVTDDGEMIDESRVETPENSADAIEKAIAKAITDLRDSHDDVTAVGVGAAGFISDRSTVVFAPNIPWRDYPLGENLTATVDLPVFIENDANAAAWGEFRFGAATGVDSMLLLTVGTGVGGGVVMDGKLQRGAYGVAAEVGHIQMVPDGVQCGCGLLGCLEVYASGSALVREATRLAANRVKGSEPLLKTAHGTPQDIDGAEITRLAGEGDQFCIDLLEWLGTWLGRGAASIVAVLDPAAVVLGGGVSAAGEFLRRPTEEALNANVTGFNYRPGQPEVRIAELRGKAGIVGAADLAREDG